MEFLVAALLIVLSIWFITRPLNESRDQSALTNEELALRDLENSKEAKLREIRDAKSDLEMGKLSLTEWEQIDTQLRFEASNLLKEIDMRSK